MIRPTRRLLAVAEALSPAAIDVAGDLMLDRYVHGEVSRISPEAPIPILEERRIEERPGGAANLALNLAALGAEVRLIGRIGDDAEGARLVDLLQAGGVGIQAVCVDRSVPTTLKTRLVAANRQVLRVDRESKVAPPAGLARDLEEALSAGQGLLVFSDYGKGTLGEALFDAARRLRPAFLVDPAQGRDAAVYRGARLLTPNRAECLAGAGCGENEDIASATREFSRRAGEAAILVKLGGEGALLHETGCAPRFFAALERPVYDVTGAGDTTLAVLARALAGGAALEDAIQLGMVGGGVAVSRFGTWACTFDELRAALAALPG